MKLLLSFLVTWILLLAGAGGDQGVVLKFKYQPAEAYEYQILDEVEMQAHMEDGSSYTYSRRQKQNSLVKVQSRDSKDVSKLLVSFKIVEDSINYPANFPENKKRKSEQLIGRSWEYSLKIGQNGEIHEVLGKDQNSTFFYERYYKTSQPVFPEEKIKPGYSWDHTVTINATSGDPICATTRYIFLALERVENHECAVIQFSSTLQFKEDLTDSKWNKEKHKVWIFDNETTSVGKIYFDYQLGILVGKENLISTKTKTNIVDKNGVSKQYSRLTVDRERFTLTNTYRDSTRTADN